MLTETVLFMVLVGHAAAVWSLPFVAWQRAVFPGDHAAPPFPQAVRPDAVSAA